MFTTLLLALSAFYTVPECWELKLRLAVRAFELLEERHPVLKTAVTLLGAAVDGFGAGFLATFAPQGLAVQSYDDATYRTLAASAEAAALRQVVRASVSAEGAK